MNVLLVSFYDSGGNAFFTATAVDKYTEHTARAVRMKQTYLQYPYDVLAPDNKMLADMVDWADVVHIRDNWDFLPGNVYEKPVVITFSGNSYRRRYKEFHRYCEEHNWFPTVSTLDLVLLNNAAWMPNARPDYVPLVYRTKPFKVCHTPTYRDRKGTDTIIKALDGLEDVELVLVEGKEYADSVTARCQCHLTIDQFRHGYGNSAIEAWAMNQPVLSYAAMSPEVVKLIRSRGHVPWYETPEHVRYIRRNVKRMRDDVNLYVANRNNGRWWYMKFHQMSEVAARAAKVYEIVKNGA